MWISLVFPRRMFPLISLILLVPLLGLFGYVPYVGFADAEAPLSFLLEKEVTALLFIYSFISAFTVYFLGLATNHKILGTFTSICLVGMAFFFYALTLLGIDFILVIYFVASVVLMAALASRFTLLRGY